VTVETDTKDVVLALPLPALAEVDGNFISSSQRWRQAVHGRGVELDALNPDGIGSVATQSAQLWLDRPAHALGWPRDVTVSGFSEPYDTFSDMTELLMSEGQPDCEQPKGLVYLCSVQEDLRDRGAPDEGFEYKATEPKEATANAVEDLKVFLWERAPFLWPQAVQSDGGIDPRLVIGLQAGALRALGDVAFDPQHPRSPFVRANSEASDRYILSLPGTQSLRIHPGNTGYRNVFAAGDWTACILDAGCIEAAAISGMLAAEAILATQLPIIGRGRRV